MIITAILPIKHNSTRVPGKNFRLMNGKPLYQWILNTLLEVEKISYIIIDTDSDIIFNDIPKYYSKHFNKKIFIHQRYPHLCPGDTSTNEILKSVINDDVLNSDYYLQTHVTNPLLKGETINKSIEYFLKNRHKNNSLFSVKSHYTRFYDKNGKDMNHNRKILIPTQNLDPIYEENSCIYIFDKQTLINENARIADNALLFEMSHIESQDIDWEHDFILTELLMKK
jgi:CMP-N-acetylneuraminic acid synthetase